MSNQTVATTSKKFTLNLSDFLKGLIMAVGAPIIAIVQQSLNAGYLTLNWKTIFTVSLSAALVYLGKNFLDKPKIVVTGATPEVMKAVKDGDIDVKVGYQVAKVDTDPEPEKVDISKFPPSATIPGVNDKT